MLNKPEHHFRERIDWMLLNLQTRPLEPSDWPAVSEIFQQGIDGGNATFETRVPSWEDFDASKRPDLRLVAVVEGAVVGWAAASAVSSRAVYEGVVEHSVYVSSEQQGKGIGRTLLLAFLDLCDAQGDLSGATQRMQDFPRWLARPVLNGGDEIAHGEIASDRELVVGGDHFLHVFATGEDVVHERSIGQLGDVDGLNF